MGNHFHDNNGWLIAGIDGHFGIHWPFVPMWFYKLNLMHPFVLGNKQRGTVFFNGVPAVAVQHEPKYLWPHLGIIPDPLDLMTPLHIFFGNHRAWLPKVSVIGEGEPLAICAIADGVSTDLDCWDFGHLPTSLVLNDGTVETTATWDDYAAGLKTALINLAIEGAIFLLTMGAGHLIGKGLSRVFEGFAEEAEVALRDVAESLEGAEREAGEAAETVAKEGAEGAEAAENAGKEAFGASEPEPGKCGRVGEPVDVASGAVVDERTDITIAGAFPLAWKRAYSSKRARRRTALGRGGWSHGFEQRIEVEDRVVTLYAEDGREIYFAKSKVGESAFHRRERLTLTELADGSFTVYSLDTRLTRELAPLLPGGPARLRAIRDAYGNAITLEYTGDKLRRIIDTAGREIRVKLDAGGRVVRVEVWVSGSLELWHDYAYTDRGELASATDALGHTETYAYDDDRRLVRKTLKNGTSFYYEFDDKTGWCVKTWGDGEIHRVELRPDLEAQTTITSGNDEPRIYTWNEKGVVIREAAPDGSFLRVRVYDDDLYLLAEENGAGERTRFEYDARGNRTKEIDPANNTMEWAYDRDQPIRRVDPDGSVTDSTYSAEGDLTGIAYESGAGFSLTYDERGRLSAIHAPEGLLTAFTWDARHDLVEERNGRGARIDFVSDALGELIQRRDARGETRVELDKAGRLRSLRLPDGAMKRAERDAMGNVTSFVDADGSVTVMSYGGTGMLRQIVLPHDRTWRFAYDGLERLRQIENPSREIYEYRYAPGGHLTHEKTFDGRRIAYRYAASGRLDRIEYPDGASREFSRDVLGNVLEERWSSGSIKIERDRLGRILLAVLAEDGGVVQNVFERDGRGQVVREKQGAHEIHYGHDGRGRRSTRTFHGRATHYRYDPLGALVEVEHDGRKSVSIATPWGGRSGGAYGEVALTS